MIDLHSHTTESDGTYSPLELVEAAASLKLEALAITDHDTFAGYDQAVARPRARGLDLICGIELSTKYRNRSIHLLGYFLKDGPSTDFRQWIQHWQDARHRRNRELIGKLQSRGFDITLEDVYKLGRNLPGRPHFAAALVQKEYFASTQEAFDKCLGETGTCFTPRDEAPFEEAVRQVRVSGGLPSLPHPGRVTRDPVVLEEFVHEMHEMGLPAIEVFHSDHSPADVEFYQDLATRLKLIPTGGSDFHGAIKPDIALGTGRRGSLNVPRSVLDRMRLGIF